MAVFTGPINTPDGTIDLAATTTTRRDRLGASVVTQLHGRFYETASRGNVYVGSSASTGIALIAPATGGGHPTLWNPSGSGVNLSVLRVTLGYVSGNNAPTTIEWASTLNTGPTIVAVTGPIITFTAVNPTSGVLGGNIQNKGSWAPTVNTFVAAPVFYRTSGLSLFTGVAATAVAPFQLEARYEGDHIIGPGTAASLCTQAATTTSLFQVTVVWEEIPV